MTSLISRTAFTAAATVVLSAMGIPTASAGGYVLPLVQTEKAAGGAQGRGGAAEPQYLRHDSEEYQSRYRDLLLKYDWLRNHPVMLEQLRRR